MALKDDPGMRMITAYLPRQDADALTVLANSQGISRAELLRRVARDLIDRDKQQRTE